MSEYASRRTLTGLMAAKPSKRFVPDDVVDELIRATCAPRSLTSSILGDPLPGRSALDRRTQQQNLADAPKISAGFKVGLSE